MTTRERLSGMLKTARPHLFRMVCCLFIFSFLLPYVDVLGCSSKKIETVHGYQLIKGGAAAFYLLALAMVVLMLALSFYRREITRSLKAFGAGWRAIAAAVAGFIIWLIPGVQFLFDNVYMLIGQLLGLVSVFLLFIDAIAISITDYSLLRKEAVSADGAGALPLALAKIHAAIVIISLALVPLYAFSLRDENILAVMYFFLLSLPFALSQAIVIQAIRREERWTLWWTPAAVVLLVGVMVIIILSFF